MEPTPIIMWTFKTKPSAEADPVSIANAPSSNMPYLVAAVIVLLIGVATIAVLAKLRPTADITVLAAVVSGFMVAITTSVWAVMKGQETHKTVNSRMDAMLVVVTELAHARGVREGQERQAAATTASAEAAAKLVADAAAALVKAAATAAATVAEAARIAAGALPSTQPVPSMQIEGVVQVEAVNTK